jgi:hypothetical protein
MPVTPYHGAVPRVTVTALAARLLPLVGALALSAGCGAPPEPLPTGPPETFDSPSSAPPADSTPTPPTGTVPTYPTYPPATLPTIPIAPATTGPPPAPRCTNGPTATQIIALIRNNAAIPRNAQLAVRTGPYCAGTWQFTGVGPPGTGTDYDPLLVVTSGKPATLKLVELGQDVCSDQVSSHAPTGIRVWACGS